MLLISAILAKTIPIIDLEANENSDYYNQYLENDRKPILLLNGVGNFSKNHSKSRSVPPLEMASMYVRFGW
jgi:hypothetical protein